MSSGSAERILSLVSASRTYMITHLHIYTDVLSYLCIIKEKPVLRPVMAQGHKGVTVNETGCGFDPHSNKLNIFIPWLRNIVKARI